MSKEMKYSPISLLLLLTALLLVACSDDTEQDKRRTVTIKAQACSSSYYEEWPVGSYTRGDWTPPKTPVENVDYSLFSELFQQQNSLVNKTIDAFFTQDGSDYQRGYFSYYQDKWQLISRDMEISGRYYLYGYIPKEDADGAAVGQIASKVYSEGAKLTLTGLNAITPSDVCVVVGAKRGLAEDDDNGLTTGQFSLDLTGEGESYIFLLFDHIYTALRFNFTVDATYDALRTIKLRKLHLTGYQDASETKIKSKYNAVITLEANETKDSPIKSVVFTPDNSSSDIGYVRLYEWDGVVNTETDKTREVILEYGKVTPFLGCFVPGQNTYFKLRSTYDVYDKSGNLIRKDATAENIFDLRNKFSTVTVERGHMYTLSVTVQPTYLYMLSEPDLDNPTVTLE